MTETAIAALVIILAGAGARRAGLIRVEDGPLLVRLVIHLGLPALVFLIVVRADLTAALLLVPVAGWAIHLLLLGAMVLLVRARGVEGPRAGALIVATAVGNTGFFGLPLIAASGEGFSLAAAVMYDTFATALITWSSTVAVASAYGEGGEGPRIDLRRLGRALALPPNWGMAAGLACNLSGARDLPSAVERPLEILAAIVLPLVMIYAGVLLDLRPLRRVWRSVAFVVVTRLVVAGAIGLGIGVALGLEGATLHTVVLMSAMPTAMMSLVLGGQYRLRTDVIAGAVVATTLLSTLTLPVLRALLL